MHGMCTLAVGLASLTDGLGQSDKRVQYLRARFSRAVLPGSVVRCTARRTGAADTYVMGAECEGRSVLVKPVVAVLDRRRVEPETHTVASCLLEVLQSVPDPRDPRGIRYPLAGLPAAPRWAAICRVSTWSRRYPLWSAPIRGKAPIRYECSSRTSSADLAAGTTTCTPD
ncbi:hypothetical protein ACQPW1_30510 [Nocardia sp. CA-128927]|uniref:hypothetical protein n=1 Tax=Nocardia sp. CA-128927 TaxID=3239975 RepID=UPI003D9966F3